MNFTERTGPLWIHGTIEARRYREDKSVGFCRCLCGQSVWYNCLIICAMFEEVLAMGFTVEAVYENGVLKPAEPLPLKEHEKVSVTVEPARPPIWERILALTADATPEDIAQVPADGAAQLDHYLYGTPRTQE